MDGRGENIRTDFTLLLEHGNAKRNTDAPNDNGLRSKNLPRNARDQKPDPTRHNPARTKTTAMHD